MSRINFYRHSLARWMIHTALKVMPEGRYRAELSASLWTLNMRVMATLAAHNEKMNPGGEV